MHFKLITLHGWRKVIIYSGEVLKEIRPMTFLPIEITCVTSSSGSMISSLSKVVYPKNLDASLLCWPHSLRFENRNILVWIMLLRIELNWCMRYQTFMYGLPILGALILTCSFEAAFALFLIRRDYVNSPTSRKRLVVVIFQAMKYQKPFCFDWSPKWATYAP